MKRPSLYVAADGVMLRAPLLPVHDWRADLADCRQLVEDPLVLTALTVGTEALAAQITRTPRTARAGDRFAKSIQRYVIRMASRATPYGLFSGVAVVRFGPATTVAISDSAPRTRTRPDMRWLLAVVTALEDQPPIRHQLRVTTHPAIHWVRGRAVLAERPQIPGRATTGAVSIRATAAVRAALEPARVPIGWQQLSVQIAALTGAPRARASWLLDQLWAQGYLVTELRPPLTHEAPAAYVVDRLARIPEAAATRAGLNDLLDAMTAWDQLPMRQRPAGFAAVTAKGRAVLPDGPTPVAQVDTALPIGPAMVNATIGEMAAEAAELLTRLADPVAAPPLTSYRHAFIARYGGNREVPLLEVLDSVHGLGPPSAEPATTVAVTVRHGREAVLRGLAQGALRDGHLSVDLSAEDVEALTLAPGGRPPLSVDVNIFVLATSVQDIDAGRFSVLIAPNAGAQAAGRTVGRFVDLLDDHALEMVRRLAERERSHDPTARHVELIYQPGDPRSANVAIRPSLWGAEIALDTNLGVPPQQGLAVSELLVGVEDDRFYVRHRDSLSRIRGHAGHMLNGSLAPPAIRFLEDVGRGGRGMFRPFGWGVAAGMPFLPRVQHRRVILSPAQWRIDQRTVQQDLRPDDPQFVDRLAAWRSAWLVPPHVYLSRGDQRLLLDLEMPDHQEQFREALHRPASWPLHVQEGLPGPEHAWLPGPGGSRHLCELVVPLVQRTPPLKPAQAAPEPAQRRVPDREGVRWYGPGSAWLYVKIYGPADRQNDLLAGTLGDLAPSLVRAGLADLWFVVRYADPASHLRIRFHGDPAALLRQVLPQLTALVGDLIDDGACTTMTVDSYERELERYGGPAAMSVAEAVFHVDSDTAVDLIAQSVDIDPIVLRVLSVDTFLGGLGVDPQQRRNWYRTRTVDRRTSSLEYRNRQAQFRQVLRSGHAGAGAELAAALSARTARLRPLGERLRALATGSGGGLTRDLDAIWASLVHMHLNRLAHPDAPSEPLVLGLLARTSDSLAHTAHLG